MHALGAIAMMLVFAGCYGYYPAPIGAPAPGKRVAAELSDSGTLMLEQTVGPDVAAVEGRLLRVTDADIELAVTTVRQHNGTTSGWRGERLVVSRGLLSRLQERRLSRGRTTLFAVAFVIGSISLRNAFESASGGTTPVVGTGPLGPR